MSAAAPDRGPLRVLFVCTGNICRSPMAATVFRQLALQAGMLRGFRVDSAGLRSHHQGRPSDRRAVAVSERRGYMWLPSPARQIRPCDFDRALVVGMGGWHVEQLWKLRLPTDDGWILSLADFFAGGGPPEVPDPYSKDEAAFEDALDLIELGCAELLHHIDMRLASPADIADGMP